MRARLAVGLEHLVVKSLCVVGRELHAAVSPGIILSQGGRQRKVNYLIARIWIFDAKAASCWRVCGRGRRRESGTCRSPLQWWYRWPPKWGLHSPKQRG